MIFNSLRMKMINVFPLFEREKRQIYSRSDSHWVTLGLQIWLEEVNAVIAKNAVGKMPQQ